MEYVLTTSALSKKYRRFEALKDFSIHVPKGAIYGFVGRNGAGKTTLIRVICGLQEPTSGSYTLYGIPNGDKGIACHYIMDPQKSKYPGANKSGQPHLLFIRIHDKFLFKSLFVHKIKVIL